MKKLIKREYLGVLGLIERGNVWKRQSDGKKGLLLVVIQYGDP